MKKLSLIFILTAGICWGTMGLFVRSLNEAGLNSFNIVAIRSFITTIIAFIFLFIFKRSLLKISLCDIWIFIGTGCCSILFFNACYFYTIEAVSLSVAAVLLYTSPIFVMFLSAILFKEKITVVKWISLILVIAGCSLVTGIIGSSISVTPFNIAIGLCSGLGYALYSIFSRFALKKGYHFFTILFYTFLFTSIGIIPFIDIPFLFECAFLSSSSFAYMILFAVITTALPYMLYTAGLKYTENGKAAVIAAVEPIVASLLGTFVFHEKMTASVLLGIVLVIVSIVISNIRFKSVSSI